MSLYLSCCHADEDLFTSCFYSGLPYTRHRLFVSQYSVLQPHPGVYESMVLLCQLHFVLRIRGWLGIRKLCRGQQSWSRMFDVGRGVCSSDLHFDNREYSLMPDVVCVGLNNLLTLLVRYMLSAEAQESPWKLFNGMLLCILELRYARKCAK